MERETSHIRNYKRELKKKNKKIVNRSLIDKLEEIQIYGFENKYIYLDDFELVLEELYQAESIEIQKIEVIHQCSVYHICDKITESKKYQVTRDQGNKVSEVYKQSLLQVAALWYDYNVLKHILKYVKEVNYNEICSPLHQAISSEESKSRVWKVRLLIKNNADVNKNSMGTYPIQLAWEYRQYGVVDILIRSGAKTDVLDLRNERTIDENLIKYKKYYLIEMKLNSLDKKYKDSKGTKFQVFFAKIQYIVNSYKFIDSNQEIKKRILENKNLQQSILEIIQVYFKNTTQKKSVKKKIREPLLIETMKGCQKNWDNYIVLDYRDKTAEQKEKEILAQREDPDCEFCKEKCKKESYRSNKYNAICCFRIYPNRHIGDMEKSGKECVDGFVGLCVCDKCDEQILEGYKDEKKVYIEFKNNEIFVQDQNNRMND